MVTLPSSFSGGMAGAVESIKRGQLPQSVTSPVVNPAQVKQTTKLPVKKTGYVPLTREQFMKAQSAGFTPDQIIEMEKRRKAELTPKPPAGNKLMEFTQGAITGATRGVGNIAKFIENAPTIGEMIFGRQKTNLPSISAPIQKGTEAISSGIENINKDLNKESIASKAGQFTGQVALTNALLPGVGGATGLGSKVVAGATEGALQGGAFDVVNQGEVTKENVGIGAAFGGALPIAGAVLSKGKEYLTSKLPTKLQLQGLMNSDKVTMLKKQLQTEGTNSPSDLAKWMLDRGIKGDKETIINTLKNRALQSRQAVDDSLAAVTRTVESNVAKKALQQSYDDMIKVAGLEDDAAKTLALLNKDTYTMSELNQVKRILDDQYNLYTKTGDPTAGLKAKGLQEIRRQIRQTIEDVAEKAGIKNIRALNNETQIANGMADAISRKDSADAVREALTAFAPTGVGGIIGGVAGPFDNNTVEGKVGNILLGMFVGRVAGSTKLKTNIASLLNKLSKQEVGALDDYIRNGGKSALPIEILDKIDDTIKLLPPPSGLPTSANVVDVQPMTGFLPGVLQKQSEAISSKVGTQPLTTGLPKNLSKSAISVSESTVLPKKTPKVNIPGNKVNNPIIQKLPKKQETPKTPEDWTKKDFTKATETKNVDKFGNTVVREQGKTSAIDSITVGGKKYTNLDIPDSSRELYELDGKVYEYKNGKMIPEGAKTPQVEVNDFYKERLAINKKKLEDTNKRLKELNDSTDTTLQGQRNNFAEKRTLEIDKKMLEDSIAGFEETLGKSPQVEGKTVDKIKAMQLEQEDVIRKGETITEEFRNKWNDLQAQYKKEFIDAKIASEKKKVDSAIRDIETKIKENPDRADWGRKQIQMEEEGFNNLKKGDYFEKKYQEHISKIREEAKKSSLLKSVKNKQSLPLSQKSEGKTEFTNPIDGKVQDPLKIPEGWASYTTAQKNEWLKAQKNFTGNKSSLPLSQKSEGKTAMLEIGKKFEMNSNMMDRKGKSIKFNDKIEITKVGDEFVEYKTDTGAVGSINKESFFNKVMNGDIKSQSPIVEKVSLRTPQTSFGESSPFKKAIDDIEARIAKADGKKTYTDQLGESFVGGQVGFKSGKASEIKKIDRAFEQNTTKAREINALSKELDEVKSLQRGYEKNKKLLSAFETQLEKGKTSGEGFTTKEFMSEIERIKKDIARFERSKYFDKPKQSLPLSQKSEVKYSKPDTLVQEAKKYKSAEEFVKAQETLYHGTQAIKARDYTAIESKMKDIYKKLGHEYKESESAKIIRDAEELAAKRSNEKLSKVQSEIADLQELLSRKISKPSSKFAGSSNKDVRDNYLGSFLTPDRDFASRFTYDISYDLAGRKTIQQKNGYLVENYFKGNTLDLSKASDYDLDFLAKTLNMPKKDIVAELKTKGGTKEIQKKLAPKKDIISKEYDAVSNYAYDSEAKKWKKEIAVMNDESLYTKQQLLDIYNKANKK